MNTLLEATRAVLALALYAIVPTAVPKVRRLLAAAAAPAQPAELAGLDAAVAAFKEVHP